MSNSIHEFIARRVAREIRNGDVVNLGIGLPTLIANYVDPNLFVMFQSENGFTGLGPTPAEKDIDPFITNAGAKPVTILPGGAFFDSATAFGIARGGHLDLTVLGALQVDAHGNIANYMIPGKMVPGMGGAMDLITGARRVIVAMEHTAKGDKKILSECTLPLTAVNRVDTIITEMAVIKVTKGGLLLREINPLYTIEQIQEMTEPTLLIAPDIRLMS